MLQTYGAALLIVLASVVIGQAICIAARPDRGSFGAPAVGLAALLVITNAAITLPGRGVTAVVVTGVTMAISAGVLWRRGVLPVRLIDLPVCIAPLLGASVPFLASGRVALPGVSVLNDSANHLVWAEGLLSPRMARLWPPPAGYPLGPHSVVASVGTVTGIPLDQGFTGLLIAAVVITALVAQQAVAAHALWRRALVALTCSLGYLVASYYGEGAFKETIMAAFLLAFVLHLEQVRELWPSGSARARWRHLLPAAILVIGAVYDYSYLGVAWFAVSTVLWIVAEAILRPRAVLGLMNRRTATSVAPWALGTLALAAIIVAPIAGQLISFAKTFGLTPSSVGTISAPLANLIGPLSPYEALGIWTSVDFRRTPANGFHAGELAAFALAILVFGFVWSVRRRRLLMPATVLGCALVWWLAQRSGSPYVAAKALTVSVPVVSALGLRALLSRSEEPASRQLLAVVAATAFCGLAAYSSYQELRNAPVQAPEAGRELARFSQTIGDAQVLFLGDDDYAAWEAHPAGVSELGAVNLSLGTAAGRPEKPWVSGQALDFDSVVPADLDRFRYVITSSGAYASQAPANFRLVRRLRLYDLWSRTGPTVPRQILEPSGAPGSTLKCSTPAGKRVLATSGVASIMVAPVTIPGPSLLPGSAATFSLPLPAGQWELSVQYTSDFDFRVTTGGHRWTMPAYLGRLGPFFDVGAVAGRGTASPLPLTVTVPRPSPVTGTGGNLFTQVSTIAATRLPDLRHTEPIRRACGRYVDWYRPG